MQRKAPPRGWGGGVLTLDAYLLHLRHLRDRLLQVLHELEELFCALGTEVEHLLLVGAKGRDDGDAVGVVWRSRSRLEAGERSRYSRGEEATYIRFQTGGTACRGGPWLCKRCTPLSSSSSDRALGSAGTREELMRCPLDPLRFHPPPSLRHLGCYISDGLAAGGKRRGTSDVPDDAAGCNLAGDPY